MQKIVFYTSPIDETKLATIILQEGEDVEGLVKKGILKKTDKHVVQDLNISPDGDLEHMIAVTMGADMLKFDDKKKPKDVVINYEALHLAYVEKMRFLRESCFTVLDRLQIRAISVSKLDVAKDIEKDKEALRNLTSTADIYKIRSMSDFVSIIPAELMVDYDEKYKGRL